MVLKYETSTADDDDLDKPAQTCIIQGTVATGCFPRYRQKGEDDMVQFKEQYLCVKINEANVFGDLNDGGEAKVWIECQWAGVTKTTRQFKRPNVNQILYFKIPIPPSERSSDSKFEDFLTKELQTKSEFQINVWADTHKANIDNIGSGKMCLANIAGHNVNYQD